MNSMKIGILLAFGLMMLAASGTAKAQIEGALSLANVWITPNPVVAGGNMTIFFDLYNSYDNTLHNVNLQLTGSYPIFNFSPTDTLEINAMDEGLYFEHFKLSLHIPKTTQEGVYTFDIVATYASSPTQSQSYANEEVGTSVMPVTVYIYNNPNITLNAIPGQIIPGSAFSTQLIVENSGYGTARNVTVRLLNSAGFEIEGEKVFRIGTLQVGQEAEENAVYFAPDNLTPGSHTLSFEINYSSDDNSNFSKIVNATVNVVINTPELEISAQQAMPPTLYSGGNQTLTLLVQNAGNGVAKNVSIEVQAGKGTQILSSSSSFFFSEIQPYSYETLPITVSAYQNATNASIIANATYYSANYANTYHKTQEIELSLAPTAQFEIIAQHSSMNPGSTDVPLTLVVKNIGNEEAEQIQLSLETTYPITPVASTYYIANLTPGSTANVTFLVSADTQAVPGNYPITVYEQWKQPNGATNQVYAGTNNYFASIMPQSSYNYNTEYAITAIVIIAIIAYAAYRSARAKRKNEKRK